MTTAALVGSGPVQAQPAAAEKASLYLVQLDGEPLASYQGGIAGIPATRPAEGQKLKPKSWNAKAYRDYLRNQRNEVLEKSGVDKAKKVVDYEATLHGFAARLTSTEVSKLERTPGVTKVWKNEMRTADTVTTPDFLGLTGSAGVWQQQFGGVANAGEGMIIGDIDSGIWPENPSFAALPEPRPDQAVIDAKWAGTCDLSGPEPVPCNNKIIGARYFSTFDDDNPVPPTDKVDARDRNGHGSHTAGTAAGNYGVDAIINGVSTGKASGMAPAARIAVYKALFNTGSGASGSTVNLAAAIDQATLDGVDVINYSVSGSRTSVVGLDEYMFLRAAAAGVFVATSAGNNGDQGPSTVAHNSPWTTTIAASTQPRGNAKTVTLGNAASYTGVGVGGGVGPAPLVDSATAGKAGVPVDSAEKCFLDSLDPAKVTGKIVLCKRGTNARVEKSQAVKTAGGVGMVLYDNPDIGLVGDFHSVPSVHVNAAAGLAVKAYIAGTASPTATISAQSTTPIQAPVMAGFSSYGPALAGGGDLLKPDITAPGVDIIAAYSPVSPTAAPGKSLFNQISGTSMSTPHIAGISLMIKAKHPDWSPMAVKSAIMTTASQTDNAGKPIQSRGADATPFDYGSGHVVPARAFDPGLVYDSGPTDWIKYACGIGQSLGTVGGKDVCDPSVYGSIDPSDLNYPSVAIGDLAGKQTVTRTVTNVDSHVAVYFPLVKAPTGVKVKVSPPVLVARPGASVSYTIEFSRTTAAFDTYAFGSLTWFDLRGHSVRSPLVVRPLGISAPAEVAGAGTNGSQALTVRPGFAGTLTAGANGLAAGTVNTRHLVGVNRDFDSDAPATGPAVGSVPLSVPAGTRIARVATYDADYPMGTDLDLFVYDAAGHLVGQSAGGSSEESVTLTAPGEYTVYVVQFAIVGVGEQDVKVDTFAVPSTAAGNLTVTPASQTATLGASSTVTLAWTGLTAGTHYLGTVEYGDGTNPIGRTIVTINP